MKKLALTILFVLFAVPALAHVATGPRSEVDYGSAWCLQQGGIGYQTHEALGIRVDCVTDTHIIEVAMHHSWRAALKKAQALALSTGLLPGVALIVDSIEYAADIQQLQSEAPANVKIWLIDEKGFAF